MPDLSILDSMNLDLLGKVWALAGSANAGEAAAVRERARAMVEREGKTLADMPGLLRSTSPASAAQSTRPADPFDGFDEWMEKREPGYGARQAQKRTERERQEKAELGALVERYGSVDAILELNPTEALLRAAVLPWCEFQEPPYDTRWIKTIDGTSDLYNADKMTARVRDALSLAIPLPTSMTEALDEHRRWEARSRERELALDCLGSTQLDLPSWYRWEIVRDLLESGLRAASLADVLIRQRHYCGSDIDHPQIREAVLLDLEHLAAQGVQNGQGAGKPAAAASTTATDRRNRIQDLLSNMDTAELSDREIARRVGVSPQTVGNIRKRVAGAASRSGCG